MLPRFERQVNEPMENHLCYCHQGNDENRNNFRNFRSINVQPPDAAAEPRNFYWIQSPWKFQVM